MTTAIIGAGAWGTTLACLASQNDDIILYLRDQQRASSMSETRENLKYLPGISLPDSIRITSNEEDVKNASHVVFAVPSIGFRSAIELFAFLDPDIPYVSVTKGLEQSSNLRMSQVIVSADPRRNDANTAVLSGPNLANEIAKSLPAATVIASQSQQISHELQKIFMTKQFRVYQSDDVIGCEIGGVAKNVVAIAVGIGDGLNYGDNAKATVMTRAIAEITRLGVAEGGKASTFSGLAGIGDLIATCASTLSRNRSVGFELGRGRTLSEIQNSSIDIAEGVFSASALLARANTLDIEMPIVAAVANVIKNGEVSKDAVEQLMTRPASRE